MPSKGPDLSPAVIRAVPQRHDGDCSVACLAMLTGLSYEEVLIAFEEPGEVLKHGAWVRHICRVADRLGHSLRVRRKWDWDEDFGILSLTTPTRTSTAHVAILWRGIIVDTDGTLCEPETFLVAEKATAKALLTPR